MNTNEKTSDFIRDIIREDCEEGRFGGRVHTRFPPEPNGYLHIGHAKAICVNFGIAEEFGGLCNLRMDDTDPTKESWEYVEAQKRDVRWLGFDWEDRLFFASDYFEQLYQWAVELIKKGKAYVDDLGPEEIREYRGTLTRPGRNSPYRDRPAEESLDLFQRMRDGLDASLRIRLQDNLQLQFLVFFYALQEAVKGRLPGCGQLFLFQILGLGLGQGPGRLLVGKDPELGACLGDTGQTQALHGY